MATSLPSWLLPAVGVGVAALVLVAVVGGPSEDERPRARKAEARRVKSAVLEDKARAKADRAYEAMGRRFDRAEAAAAKKGTKTATAKVAVVERKIDRLDEIKARIDSGQATPSELRELMKSGTLRIANPDGSWFGEPTVSGDTALAKARAMSSQFLGTDREVVELDASERKPLPKYAMVLGKLSTISYEPAAGTTRGDTIWDHNAGDRGPFEPAAMKKMLLVADPETRHIHLVQNHAATVFDPGAGIIG